MSAPFPDALKDSVLNIIEKKLSEQQQESIEETINFLLKDHDELKKVQKRIEDVFYTLERVHRENMKRSRKQIEELFNTYKLESTRRAKEMLRKEFAKKRAAVMLTQEDVQDYMDNKKQKKRK